MADFDVNGKTILLTGAAGILGSQYADKLASLGAKLVLIDRDEKVHNLVDGAESYVADIANPDEWDKIEADLASKNIEVDVLINNAAAKSENFFEPFESFPMDDWNEVMGVNLNGAMLACQKFGAKMAARGEGSIINILSIYGLVAPDKSIYEGSEYNGRAINTPAIYSASKAALWGLTKYLATYWGEKGVRVNAITPGGVESGQNDTFRKKYEAKVPLGRMGNPEDLFGALVFLSSDSSSYITGQNIIVDGGWTVW